LCQTVERNRSLERYGKGASNARKASFDDRNDGSELAAKVEFRVPIPAILHLKLPGFLLPKIAEPLHPIPAISPLKLPVVKDR
jgi:hypothetical protein